MVTVRVRKFSGARLRKAREEMQSDGRFVSQEQFAKRVGVSRRTPGRWENGESSPQAAQLGAICAVTGKSADYFFADEDDEESDRVQRAVSEFIDAVGPALPGLVVDLIARAREANLLGEEVRA